MTSAKTSRRPRGARRHRARPANRGAVLVIALLISALIAVALVSYLSLNLSSTRLARATFDGYAALNLADAGTEEGVWSLNHAAAADPAAWTDWTSDGTAAWKKFPNFTLGSGATGWVKVYVDTMSPAPGTTPKVIAQSSVSSPGSLPVQRMVAVTLRRRSYFANGLVAKQSVVFNGANASVDSWNSDPDGNPATAPVDYSSAVRNDHGSVASVDVSNSAVTVNQANVWGYVSTGGSAPQVGSNGTIRGASTPADVKVDPARVATDFNADFPLVTAPTDGVFLPLVGSTLGVPGTTTKWRTSGIALSGTQTLTIYGNVILTLTGATSISVTGKAAIVIPTGSSLTVYAAGDVRIGGQGLANSNVQASSCQIWGTNTTQLGQDIQIAGNGALRAVVYAPNGDVSINGNGDAMGSIVARNITLVGNAAFHYDEALANFGTTTPFAIAKWRQLESAADRAPYNGVFSGW